MSPQANENSTSYEDSYLLRELRQCWGTRPYTYYNQALPRHLNSRIWCPLVNPLGKPHLNFKINVSNICSACQKCIRDKQIQFPSLRTKRLGKGVNFALCVILAGRHKGSGLIRMDSYLFLAVYIIYYLSVHLWSIENFVCSQKKKARRR